MVEDICRGGLLETIGDPLDLAMLIPHQNIDSVCNPPDSGEEDDDADRIDPARVCAILRAIARSDASPVERLTLIQDTDDAYEPSRETRAATAYATLDRYLTLLRRQIAIEEQKARTPPLRSPIRLRSSPKLHLADTSLAVGALGASANTLRHDFKTLGMLFESMAFRDLVVYAPSFGARVLHHRDSTELESDESAELADGSWGASEVNLSPDRIDKAAAVLVRLKTKMAKTQQDPPRCLCVIVGTLGLAYTHPDGVQAAPLACLKP